MALVCGVVTVQAQLVSSVEGRVFEADGSTPIVSARVSLTRVTDSTMRHAQTDEAGRYEFARVPSGRYWLTIARIGYDPATIELTVQREAPLRVEVGMVVTPIRLRAVDVRARDSDSPGSPASMAGRPKNRREIITREEIERRAAAAANAFELVRRLRPAWLINRGVSSTRVADRIVVYVDNVRRGDLESLRSVQAGAVAELWFIDPLRATQQWGTGHASGVIHVIQRP